MLIEFLKTGRTRRLEFEIGQIEEIDDRHAEAFIATGVAREVKDEPEEVRKGGRGRME